MKLFICFFGTLILSFTRLVGQMDTLVQDRLMDHIEADRPDQSESASLVPKGYFQMEHGFSIEDTDPGFIYSYPSSLWKYGVNENFEIRLETQYITIQKAPNPDVKGFLPLSLGFKSKLTDQHGALPKMAFIGQLTFPGIVEKDFETTYFAPKLLLAFNHQISNFIGLDYTAGAEWDGETGEPNFLYSLSVPLSLTRRIGIFGEVYGSTPQREDGDIELRVDAGITFLTGRNFVFDISAGQGLTDKAVERFVSFGFSYRFKV